MKSWHLNTITSRKFRKIGSHLLQLLHFLTLNRPTDKNAFVQFGGFPPVRSHIEIKLCHFIVPKNAAGNQEIRTMQH